MGNILNYGDYGNTKGLSNKCNEYIAYINEHIENVRKTYLKLFCNPNLHLDIEGYTDEQIHQIIEELEVIIRSHDMSKFGSEEFYAYRNRFFPTELEEMKMKTDSEYADSINMSFETAWQHHYLHNDHHPKFWGPNKDMSLLAIFHMICDWEAMSIKFNSKTIDWYNNKAKDEKEQFSPKTKRIVESVLEQLYGVTLPKDGEASES